MENKSWDERGIFLWEYNATWIRLANHALLKFFFKKEIAMTMDFTVTSFRIILGTRMFDDKSLEERLNALMELEEDYFILGFNTITEKWVEKYWHNRYHRRSPLEHSMFPMLYYSNILKNHGNFMIYQFSLLCIM